MGRGKKSMKGGCSICNSQEKAWKENKKERLKAKLELKTLNKLTETSELTTEDAIEIGEKVKRGIARRHNVT